MAGNACDGAKGADWRPTLAQVEPIGNDRMAAGANAIVTQSTLQQRKNARNTNA